VKSTFYAGGTIDDNGAEIRMINTCEITRVEYLLFHIVKN
jgi:hypothetical protein